MPANILLDTFQTPFATFPFDKIQLTDFVPAIEQSIAEAKQAVEAIAKSTESPTFQNTIVALEHTGHQLGIISHALFNLNHAETNADLQQIAKEVSPKLAAYSNDIMLNHSLFLRIKQLYETRHQLGLDEVALRMLEKTFKSFARNGANLDEKAQTRLREIDQQMAKLTLEFSEHVLADTQVFQLEVTDPQAVKGIPQNALEEAKLLAESQGKPNSWIFTLQYPSYMPFITYCPDRTLREQMFRAFSMRGFQANPHNNTETIRQLVTLRHERAQLLGYATHAEFVLEERMAKTPEQVQQFLNHLLQYAKPAALREMEELQQYAKQIENIDQLQRWDIAYFSEKLKKEKFDIDDELLKPYFQIENVITGIFTIAERLFGLHFIENKAIPVYHPDVKAYEVKDLAGNHISVFYADFFARPSKKDGAWMTSFREQYTALDGTDIRPHVSIVCNFSKSTASQPALLTFQELTTFFHEFGHALHGMLSKVTYPSVSGTNVYWDFVELPSQLMENWAYEQESLDLFARHYQTHEPIPQAYIQRIKDSSNFMSGYQTVRQISFGKLDLAWHAQLPASTFDLLALEKQALSETSLLPEVAGVSVSAAFSHIFAGGYSAGYYSYKWAEVLEADAFALFQEKGIFNKEVAQAYAQFILSKGGSQDPMELYKAFRGHEPKPEALLKKAGLLQEA